MNQDSCQNEDRQAVEDAELEMALSHFKQSVHGWSEQEFSRVRLAESAAPRAWWARMRMPVAAWTMAGALLVAAIAVPVEVGHQRSLTETHRKELDRQAKDAATAAVIAQDASMISDEELLDHVDSDIAQAAPDALEPLATMMSETESKVEADGK
jgi:hypothetical protein